VSILAVVVVAALAGVFLFGPRGLFGTGLGPSPTSAATPETASVGPSVTQAVEPTPSPVPTPTAVPTPEPTPEVATWVGLEWSDPIDPSLNVNDAIWWHDRYIGVGYVTVPDHPSDNATTYVPLFLTSPDGVAWDVVQELEPIVDDQADPHQFELTGVPNAVVPADDGLLALVGSWWFGGGALWRSADGVTWTASDTQGWDWGDAHVIGIAGGPEGVVAIGAGAGCALPGDGAPIVLHSDDGSEWERVTPSAPAPSSLSDVVAFSGGFLLAGSIGELPCTNVGGYVGTAAAAAWVSTDGVTWTAATLDGAEPVRGGRLWEIAVGSEGVFALGYASPIEEYDWHGATMSGWASTDGSAWTYLGEVGDELPFMREPFLPDLVSDGTRMLALVPDGHDAIELAAWTSLDGFTWTRLSITGDQVPARSQPEAALPVAGSGVTGVLSHARLTRDGIVAFGTIPLGPTWDDPKEPCVWVVSAQIAD
jgi:hypothetical protein